MAIPPRHPDSIRSWRRLVQYIDPAATGAYALCGSGLEAGVAYTLPDGALVVVCDKLPDRFLVQLLRVTEHALAEEKTWELKAALGKRVVDYIGRRLLPGAGDHRARRAESMPNRYQGRCATCRRTVTAGQGVVHPASTGLSPTVTHRPGECPPPPEVLVPNRRSEPCLVCGRWVAAGAGIARLRTQPSEATGSAYQACHQGECPLDAPLGPTNRMAGWCSDCGHLVPAGQGWRHPFEDAAPLRHLDNTCPEPDPFPSWIVKRPRKQEPLQPGQVRRVRVDLRGGVAEGWVDLLMWARWKRPDNADVPPAAPGFRVLRDSYVEMVGVILETVGGGRRSQSARVRAATPEEAAELLAAELADEAGLPLPLAQGGHKADWSAERIGTGRPWLAEITGRHPDYEYERLFPPFRADYAGSNSKGTRGVWYHWTLTPGRVYEVAYPLSHREWQREFLRATPEGDTVVISAEEVESWLNGAAAWAAR
ncbi:MAG TPA: hypothetical protein DD420_35015 [Streptomyces sp.]|nr:hypothetical protein [Streptomyces sp.]